MKSIIPPQFQGYARWIRGTDAPGYVGVRSSGLDTAQLLPAHKYNNFSNAKCTRLQPKRLIKLTKM
jgi:hypothetical protein